MKCHSEGSMTEEYLFNYYLFVVEILRFPLNDKHIGNKDYIFSFRNSLFDFDPFKLIIEFPLINT